jgi:hypothetical protein
MANGRSSEVGATRYPHLAVSLPLVNAIETGKAQTESGVFGTRNVVFEPSSELVGLLSQLERCATEGDSPVSFSKTSSIR